MQVEMLQERIGIDTEESITLAEGTETMSDQGLLDLETSRSEGAISLLETKLKDTFYISKTRESLREACVSLTGVLQSLMTCTKESHRALPVGVTKTEFLTTAA